MLVFWAILLIVLLLVCWCANLFGLPGNWAMIVCAVVYWFFIPEDSRAAFGWLILLAIILLAVVGEIIEFAAGAMGTAKAGGSRRSAVLALVGSLVGGIGGLMFGLPIPVVGQVIASLVLGSLGALVGAMLGESWKGRDLDSSIQVGKAAFWGRLFGTLGKLMCGGLMVLSVLVAVCV